MGAGINAEVFALPYKDGFIVYSPLAGRIIHANAQCVSQLRDYLETGDIGVVSPEVVTRFGGLQWLHSPPPPVALPVDRHFHPTAATLFLTNRCNLRCLYCYARAGEFAATDMSPAVYRSAINWVMNNARRTGFPAQVGFHGGGEPTLAWPELVGAVEYARGLAQDNEHPGVRFAIATNGVMSAEHREYVASTFESVTLSFDGPPDLQNRMRPLIHGQGSFEEVMAFVEVLVSHKTRFGIRSTITNQNVGRMVEMIDYFTTQTGCKLLHFEPAFLNGRCCTMADAVPEPETFAEHFIKAMDRARERGADLRFSAARLADTFLSFCGCALDPFSITPTGDVTACFEVCDRHDPLATDFHFGHFDESTGRFNIDVARLSRLRSLTVDNKPLCTKCVAKWSCSGDCPVKGRQPFSLPEAESRRCRMIQPITRAMLERAVENAPCRAC